MDIETNCISIGCPSLYNKLSEIRLYMQLPSSQRRLTKCHIRLLKSIMTCALDWRQPPDNMLCVPVCAATNRLDNKIGYTSNRNAAWLQATSVYSADWPWWRLFASSRWKGIRDVAPVAICLSLHTWLQKRTSREIQHFTEHPINIDFRLYKLFLYIFTDIFCMRVPRSALSLFQGRNICMFLEGSGALQSERESPPWRHQQFSGNQ